MKFLLLQVFTCAISVFLFSTCSTSNALIVSNIQDLRKDSIILTDVIPLYHLLEINNQNERFAKNLFIGGIFFSGGLIQNSNEGMLAQSKTKEFVEQNKFESSAISQYNQILLSILTEKKIPFIKITNESIYKSIQLNSEEIKIQNSEDGHDNINIPRIKYEAISIDTSFSNKLIQNDRAKYILIPIIEYYYGHNGGWFNDQYYGCGAGARTSLHIYMFDLNSGKPVFIFQNYESILYDYKFKISVFEMECELIKLVDKMSQEIKKALP